MTRLAAALRRDDDHLRLMIGALLDRLQQVDAEVMAWLPETGRRERVLADAAALARAWPAPGERPVLYGVPVGVKDIFHADGFVTRAGTALPPQLFAGPEATAVTRLRDAGAVLMGKTVTTEFAFAEPGPTHNPHRLGHTPGGSSSGSAAAVACGTCLLALGTQTIGSVIRPAAFCGVVGVKPSYDRVPTAGLVYFSRTADHVGFFAQDVAAARMGARVLYDSWHEDRSLAPGRLPVIGVPAGPYLEQASPAGLNALRAQLDALRSGGYDVREVAVMQDIAAINHRHRRMVAAEVAAEHAEWFAGQAHLYRPRTAAIIRDGLTVGPDELAAARAGCLELRLNLAGAMAASGVDIWACPPAAGTAPYGLDSTGDPVMNLPWTHAGLPVVTVPAGLDADGLPYGLQLAAAFGADELLLAWAEGIAAITAGLGLIG
jgi:Asp-tRNA(Asn)/Glu-tRNA(Gln) amidotransferase A subunit family amidase